jgi:hypothetical protein
MDWREQTVEKRVREEYVVGSVNQYCSISS